MIPQTLSQARKLIDELRSKLLSKPSAREVQKLGMSLTNGLDLTNATSMAEVAETVELFQEGRRRSGQPRNLELDRAARALGAPVKPAPAASAPPRPATTTATKSPAKAPARVPTPPAKETNDEYLRRRVAEQQSAARAVAAAAPKVELRPLAEVSTGELVQLANHQFARPAEKAAAAAELDRRPEVTVFRNGSYSISTRGTRKAKP